MKKVFVATKTRRHSAVIWNGVRNALGVPGIAVFSSMLGFGALAESNGLNLLVAVSVTLGVWALPGQIVLVDLYPSGSLVALFFAVLFVNARFFPLALATLPLVKGAEPFRALHLLYAHLLSVISWSHMTTFAPKIEQSKRPVYFVSFTITVLTLAVIATIIGYLAAGKVPYHFNSALLIIPTIYLLLLAANASTLLPVVAVFFGGGAVVAIDLSLPGWGLVLGGFVGGTLAFLLGLRLERRSE